MVGRLSLRSKLPTIATRSQAVDALRGVIEPCVLRRRVQPTDWVKQKSHPNGWASVGRLSLRSKASRLATRSQVAVALRRTTEPSSALRIGFFTDRLGQKENHPKGWASVGRLSLCSKASRLATRSQAAVALRRTTEPSSALRIGFFTDRLSQTKIPPKWVGFLFGAEGGIRTLV